MTVYHSVTSLAGVERRVERLGLLRQAQKAVRNLCEVGFQYPGLETRWLYNAHRCAAIRISRGYRLIIKVEGTALTVCEVRDHRSFDGADSRRRRGLKQRAR